MDSSGDIVFAGHSTGSFEGYTNAGDWDFRRRGAGTLQWIFQTGTNGTDHAENARVDSSGNIVRAGHSTGRFEGHANVGDYGMVVMKLSNAGTLQWIFQTGTNANPSRARNLLRLRVRVLLVFPKQSLCRREHRRPTRETIGPSGFPGL